MDAEKLVDAEACAVELRRCLDQSFACAAHVVGYKQLAVRHAVNVGYILLRVKEILPHGEFLQWCEKNAPDLEKTTRQKWIALANSHKNDQLDLDEDTCLTLAYRKSYEATPPKSNEQGETEDKPKLPWSPLKFSTRVEQWTKEQAMDFIYEFDRAAQFVRALKLEFGL